MSSFQRTRSLRRPAPVTTDPPPEDTSVDPRNSSPSRLPVTFHARSRSTVTTADSTRTTTTTRTRPTSVNLGRGAPTKTSAVSSTYAQEPTKREGTKYPPSTTVTRQQPSHGRPGSSGNAAPLKRVTTHTRAKSTTASVNPNTVLRPPSRDLANGPTARANAAAHRRNVSVEKSVTSSAVHTPTKPTATGPPPRLRPTFSTLQQHYSPAKTLAPKPSTSSYLAPPSPSKLPANVAASAETNRLQAELLQLHLLHRDAAVVEQAWRESSRKKLGERVERLDEESREVGKLERDRAEAENALALRRWGGDDGLDQKIQALDAIMNGVWALSEGGGRYARTVRRFERWLDRVSEIEDSRRSGTALLQGNGNLFISELDAPWREECPDLIRRLDAWKRQLSDLGDLPSPEDDGNQPASLVRMLTGCGSLVRNMLAELMAMEQIEEEALHREEEWTEKVNREDDDDDTPRAGAIWRTV